MHHGGQSLNSFLKSGGLADPNCTYEPLLNITNQLINGYNDIRTKKIIHADLKFDNILFDGKELKVS